MLCLNQVCFACHIFSLIVFCQIYSFFKCIEVEFSRLFSLTVHDVIVQLSVVCKNLVERILVLLLCWILLTHGILSPGKVFFRQSSCAVLVLFLLSLANASSVSRS